MSIDVTPTGLGELDLQVERELVDNPDRHSQRWTLVSGGLANVWRYGDLPLDAPSGRLLLRGANGTGKTTALEALCPYLLDLNAAKLAAGKARPTTLNLLMSEGADGKRRTGYAWLTFAAPHEVAAPQEQPAERSWGVRLQYAPNGSPKVRVIPFTVPGRPLRDLALFGPERAALTSEQFEAALVEAGGETFEDPDDYVEHLAATVWRCTRTELTTLTAKLRDVRNPSLLAEVNAESAATALRSALPTVAADIVADTAKALAASDETRDAFERDRRAAEDLTAFAATWTGHVADVVGKAHTEAAERQRELTDARRDLAEKTKAAEKAVEETEAAAGEVGRISEELATVEARLLELTGSEEYQAADRLHQLRRQLASERQLAQARLAQLLEAANGSRETGRQLRTALADLSADLAEIAGRLTRHDDQPAPDLIWRDRPRSVHTVGDAVADPGPGLEITSTTADLTAVADRWSGTGRQLLARAESAELAGTDHQQNVAAAEQLAVRLRSEATQAANRRDELRDTAHRAATRAGDQQRELLAQLAAWATTHPALCRPQDTDELPSLTAAEPGQVLAAVEDWYTATQQTVTEQASNHKAAAARHRERADQLDEQAEACRTEATDWRRDGKLLPLPRPGWAAATDGPLLGDVLTWADAVGDVETRNRLEVALADAGILGASLTGPGASGVADTAGDTAPAAPTWQVRADGPVRPMNLTAVLAVDLEHPDAEIAVAVLERIALVESAHARGSQDDPAALVVGYDGSFAAGNLVGHRLAAGQPAPAAALVGARQRREAALATAARLDAEAAALDALATAERTAQGTRERQAAALTAAVGQFPSRQSLTRAEDRRVLAQQQAGEAREQAERADEKAGRAEEQARTAHREWAARCRDRDLPADLRALTELATGSRQLAQQFTDAARAVRGRPVAKLTDMIDRAAADTAAAGRLPRLHADAHTAHEDATGTAAMVQAREEVDGASIEEVLAKVEAAERTRARLRRDGPVASKRHEAAISEQARTEAEFRHAQQSAERAEPAATVALTRLARLLRIPGVLAALGGEPDAPVPGGEGGGSESAATAAGAQPDVLDLAERLLAGRKTVARKTLAERYDQARANLAGLWALDPGEEVDGLATFVLVHNDEAFTPAAAAEHAARLADGAAQALADAEDSALRTFIIGQLPKAIGGAWQRLLDWKLEVNAKMRATTASSGVGVQVEIVPSETMSPPVRLVYELSCLAGRADRGAEEDAAVGRALRSLIDAADGDTMVEKVAAAVDIRTWVDVFYRVQRPGQKPARWGRRTGLSGGERRLVVLAPMLAAIAASYDNLDPAGLRLVALDEVPAEVDEAGREGLARYLAALDLDLMCTSYLWDGAPGAWDGIDAWDFEGDETGTVVAFPMLVRGLGGFPGDEALFANFESRSGTP